MKRFLTFLALLLTFSVSAQTFQVATQIVASPDCKLKFLNKIDSQIYEVNSVDMTWQYLTTTTIKIKDYDNEVTIYKNNITSPIFANIPAFLDSVQGACMGGSGGGGVQSIVAGTNITVDDTDPQNPIVSSTGGGGSDSTIYKTDGSTTDNRTAEFKGGLNLKSDNVIKNNVGNYNYITNTRGFAFASNTDSILLLDSMFGAYYRHVIPMTLNTQLTHKHYVDSMVASGGGGGAGDLQEVLSNGNIAYNQSILIYDTLSNLETLIYPSYIGLINHVMPGIFTEQMHLDSKSLMFQYGDAFDMIERHEDNNGQNTHYLQDKTGVLAHIEDLEGYLPLNIQDSTTVELNGNSVIFKGDNHSLALNRPFDALAIGGAVMDGFQAQQYDSIYTMNGVMKVPVFFGDTIRYPMLFMSDGMPFSDYYKLALFKPFFDEPDFGFSATLNNQDDININHIFSNTGYILSQDGNANIRLSANGDITATGEIKGTSYATKTSLYSYAQMQDVDLTRTIYSNPANNTLINPATKEAVVVISSDSVDIVLPDPHDCEFWHLYVKNTSVTPVNITSVSGSYIFWESISPVDSVDVSPGSLMHIIFDGGNYLIK